MVDSEKKTKKKKKIKRNKEEKNESSLFVFGEQSFKRFFKDKKKVKKLDNPELLDEKSDRKDGDLTSFLFESFEDKSFKESVLFGESSSNEKGYFKDSEDLKRDFSGYESLYDSKYSKNNYDEKKDSEKKENYSFFEKSLEDFSDRIKPYKPSVLEKNKD